MLTELNLKLESDTKALPFLERIAPLQPKETRRLANDLLRHEDAMSMAIQSGIEPCVVRSGK